MQSQQFGELAAAKGISGITIRPYSQQFADLIEYVRVTKSNG
jgi:hypothetical protein